MDMGVMTEIALTYVSVGFFVGIMTGIFRENLLDGLAIGFFWPLFIIKRAWELLK